MKVSFRKPNIKGIIRMLMGIVFVMTAIEFYKAFWAVYPTQHGIGWMLIAYPFLSLLFTVFLGAVILGSILFAGLLILLIPFIPKGIFAIIDMLFGIVITSERYNAFCGKVMTLTHKWFRIFDEIFK